MSQAEGRFAPPADAAWILLLADMTGLPAVARILEEVPPGPALCAHLEIPGPADRQALPRRDGLALHWHQAPAVGPAGLQPEAPTRLLAIARGLTLPSGPGYVWIAGEVSAVAGCRDHFRDVCGLDKARLTAVGYWILGQARG